MTSAKTPTSKPKFCSACGTRLLPDALFCHECGATIDGQRRADARVYADAVAGGTTTAVRWGVPALAILAVVLLSVWTAGSRGSADTTGGVPLGTRSGVAPDLSSMSPEEQADRLFNRVMRLSSEGKADSAAFFAGMALGALESLQPLDAHRRYDMGLVALVAGDAARAQAQADTILARRTTHLLGLSLAARAADARGDVAAARAFRRRLLAAESTERAQGLQEYADHDADIRAAVELARKG